MPVTVGTPPQEANFLVDLQGSISHVFLKQSSSYLTQLDKFYSKGESETARYLNSTNVFQSEVAGLHMHSYFASDELCVDDLCFTSDLYAANQLVSNSYMEQYDLSSVGGILGLGQNATGSASFWENSGFSDAYAIQLRPTESDFAWLSDFELTNTQSVLTPGTHPGSDSTQKVAKVKTGKDGRISFGLSDVGFNRDGAEFNSILNQPGKKLNQKEHNLEKEKEQMHRATVQMAFPGIGLPPLEYKGYVDALKDASPDLHCVPGQGNICYAEKSCSNLADEIDEFNFYFTFETAVDRTVKLPITAAMRE